MTRPAWITKNANLMLSTGDTISITYTISIPTYIPLTSTEIEENLNISNNLGEVTELEEPAEKKVIKTVCIDFHEVLVAMDGVEVGDAV